MQADEGQIRQVFQNIIINACQAMPSGGLIRIQGKSITISDNQLPPLKAGNYLEVLIADQGGGISPQILPRIFDPYFTTKQGGNGIGLAIVYRILTWHHGHITVTSEVGRGTIFTVYLPIFTADSNQTPTVSQKAQIASGRVLIMDDEAVIRMTLSALLKQLGYTVDAAQNGEEALEKFDQAASTGENYKFVITDLTVIGGMGGKKLAQEITLRNPLIPIIVSSGYSDDLGLSTFKDIYVTAFLRKPYSFKELKAALEIIA
jgi:CheY-like chemotaxis protein/anti-sigma regulatory factor (Ser/Thr protein kinase)